MLPHGSADLKREPQNGLVFFGKALDEQPKNVQPGPLVANLCAEGASVRYRRSFGSGGIHDDARGHALTAAMNAS